jgi:hypothetical protein
MGSSCSKIEPIKATVNPSDKINDPIPIKDACAPIGSGKMFMKHLIPDNGEYEWNGEDSFCYYCSLEAPKQSTCSFGCSDVNCCAIVGRTGTYKRVAYNADPKDCCLKGCTMINGKTCNPIFRDQKGPWCYNYIKDYCVKSNDWNCDVCKTWCAQNKDECADYRSKQCNVDDGVSKPGCLDWCMQNHGKCDTMMKRWCVNNPGDPRCACILSDMHRYNHNPLCVDRKCIDNGYQTSSMISSRGEGCKIIDCRTYFDIKSRGKVDIDDFELMQMCGNDGTYKQKAQSGWWLGILLFVTIFLCFIINYLIQDS